MWIFFWYYPCTFSCLFSPRQARVCLCPVRDNTHQHTETLTLHLSTGGLLFSSLCWGHTIGCPHSDTHSHSLAWANRSPVSTCHSKVTPWWVKRDRGPVGRMGPHWGVGWGGWRKGSATLTPCHCRQSQIYTESSEPFAVSCSLAQTQPASHDSEQHPNVMVGHKKSK